jgi:hypothetical protein
MSCRVCASPEKPSVTEVRKVIVIDDCSKCPLTGGCKPWKDLSGKQKAILLFGVGVGKFILKGCPLPDSDTELEAFAGLD